MSQALCMAFQLVRDDFILGPQIVAMDGYVWDDQVGNPLWSIPELGARSSPWHAPHESFEVFGDVGGPRVCESIFHRPLPAHVGE